ncbi:hypothetical protein Q3G72_019506 [Acer saccharum]|nr:hypothetical protein Q3G72_019506 [Acer saccharum]
MLLLGSVSDLEVSVNTELQLAKSSSDHIPFLLFLGDDHLFAPNDRVSGWDWFMSFADLEDPKQGRTAPPSHYLIEIKSFSLLKASKISFTSDAFDAGDYKWKAICLKHLDATDGILCSTLLDIEEAKGIAFQFFLSQSSIPLDTRVVVKFILRVKDQKNGNHVEFEDNYLFAPNENIWGCNRFMSFADLEDPKQGFLVDDTLIIEAEVTLLGLVLAES